MVVYKYISPTYKYLALSRRVLIISYCMRYLAKLNTNKKRKTNKLISNCLDKLEMEVYIKSLRSSILGRKGLKTI